MKKNLKLREMWTNWRESRGEHPEMPRKHLLLEIVERTGDTGEKEEKTRSSHMSFDKWMSGAQTCSRGQNKKQKESETKGQLLVPLDFLIKFQLTKAFVGEREREEKGGRERENDNERMDHDGSTNSRSRELS